MMKMFVLLTLLCFASSKAEAETIVIPFKKPKGFPLSIKLILPKEGATVVSHEETNEVDTITACIDDTQEKTGMLVEAVDAKGKRLWSHDFGYNKSAVPGCSAAVAFHPQLTALIISYDGYKWDHDSLMLFVNKTGPTFKVSEYSKNAPDIVPFLKKQPSYSSDHKYWLYPERFAGCDVVFSCVPLNLPERQAVHPLAQDVSWFQVSAAIDSNFKLTPLKATVSH